MPLSNLLRPVAAAGLAAALLATPSLAQVPDDPADAVDYRQSQMGIFGDNLRVIVGFLRQGNGTMADVQAAAANMVEISPNITDWFPEGTGVGVSDSAALPGIWEDWDTFAQGADNATLAIAQLAAAALRADEAAVGEAFGGVGMACGACHERFQQEN